MLLSYPPFSSCAELEAAAANKRPLRLGSRGSAVRLLQGALIDLEFKLPRSLAVGGSPDGIFGDETHRALKAFQVQRKLSPDGVAGFETLFLLDGLLIKKHGSLPHQASASRPLPTETEHYALGSGDPPLGADSGAGPWRSRPPTAVHMGLRAAILQHLPLAIPTVGYDAAKHLHHYLMASGKDYTLDLESMVKQVPSARARLESELGQAKDFVEQLDPGRHPICSRKAQGGYNRQEENSNWYFATGGYSRWGKGVVTVTERPGGRHYQLDFEYRVYDRYNWDQGKSVTLGGITITDEFMGEFHRQGLAREFDCWGSIRRQISWKKGEKIARHQLDAPSGGRG